VVILACGGRKRTRALCKKDGSTQIDGSNTSKQAETTNEIWERYNRVSHPRARCVGVSRFWIPMVVVSKGTCRLLYYTIVSIVSASKYRTDGWSARIMGG
jgi:hypothetical protein